MMCSHYSRLCLRVFERRWSMWCVCSKTMVFAFGFYFMILCDEEDYLRFACNIAACTKAVEVKEALQVEAHDYTLQIFLTGQFFPSRCFVPLVLQRHEFKEFSAIQRKTFSTIYHQSFIE